MSTNIATSSTTNGFLLYPSNNNQVAYLPDGSLIFLVGEGVDLKLYQIALPDAATPSATSVTTFTLTGLTAASTISGDIFVKPTGSGTADVWVAYGENNNDGGAGLQHATYSNVSGWSWDSAVSILFNGSAAAAVDMAEVVWTGTYLIVGRRAQVGGSTGYFINYTTDKTGATGWQANLIQLSGTTGGSTHYFGSLMHDDTLGCTVAVYTVNGDTIQSRVLPDSSSPALANWGSQTALGTGTGTFDNFQGPSTFLDHATGRVHVAYSSGSAGMDAPGYVTGTVTVNGTSSAVTWGTPIAVGTQSQGANASVSMTMDAKGRIYLFWNNHYPNNTASDIFYATIDPPYTSASAQTQYTSGTDHVQTQVPKRDRIGRGYVPLFYWTGTGAPYTIVYDTGISATFALSDAGTGTDSVAIGIVIPTDSASGTDSVSVNTGTTSISVSDSASGSDSQSTTLIVPTDSAAGTDTPSLGLISPAVADVAPVTTLYDFENQSTAGWTTNGGEPGTFSTQTAHVHDGTYALKFATTAWAASGFDDARPFGTNVSPAQATGDTFSVWVLVDAGSPGTSWQAFLAFSDGATGHNWVGNTVGLTPGTWAQLTCTPPADAWVGGPGQGLIVQFQALSSAGGLPIFYIDTVQQYGTVTGLGVTTAPIIGIPQTDSASGADTPSLGTISPAPGDSGSGSEGESIGVTAPIADSAVGSESVGIIFGGIIPILVNDAAAGATGVFVFPAEDRVMQVFSGPGLGVTRFDFAGV